MIDKDNIKPKKQTTVSYKVVILSKAKNPIKAISAAYKVLRFAQNDKLVGLFNHPIQMRIATVNMNQLTGSMA